MFHVFRRFTILVSSMTHLQRYLVLTKFSLRNLFDTLSSSSAHKTLFPIQLMPLKLHHRYLWINDRLPSSRTKVETLQYFGHNLVDHAQYISLYNPSSLHKINCGVTSSRYIESIISILSRLEERPKG